MFTTCAVPLHSSMLCSKLTGYPSTEADAKRIAVERLDRCLDVYTGDTIEQECADYSHLCLKQNHEKQLQQLHKWTAAAELAVYNLCGIASAADMLKPIDALKQACITLHRPQRRPLKIAIALALPQSSYGDWRWTCAFDADFVAVFTVPRQPCDAQRGVTCVAFVDKLQFAPQTQTKDGANAMRFLTIASDRNVAAGWDTALADYERARLALCAPLPQGTKGRTRATQFMIDFLCATNTEIEDIKNADQRTPAWHLARKYRITASNFGAATGRCKYTKPLALVKEKLWNTFTGNDACAYGTWFEDTAEVAFRAAMQFAGSPVQVDHCGLIVQKDWPFIGLSPDGLVTEADGTKALLEIKCPYGRGPPMAGRIYDEVPPQYMAQIQGIMGFLGLPKAYFVVYTFETLSVRVVPFDAGYFESLKADLHNFYFTKYLPALFLQQDGKLRHGEIEPSIDLYF